MTVYVAFFIPVEGYGEEFFLGVSESLDGAKAICGRHAARDFEDIAWHVIFERDEGETLSGRQYFILVRPLLP